MFVSYDIQPVRENANGTCIALDALGENTPYDFWSLYGRDGNGCVTCVGDCHDFETARDVYVAITGNTSVPTEPAVLMGLPVREPIELLDERKKEQARLLEQVRERFDAYNLSKIPLDKLLQIADILGIEHEVPADR